MPKLLILIQFTTFTYFNLICYFKLYNLITFRENGINDVTIKILYCGICHTDLHQVRNDWGITMYPIVPGYVFNIFFSLSRFFYSIAYNIYIYANKV